MQHIFSGSGFVILERLLVLCCIAVPPWMIAIKHLNAAVRIPVILRFALFLLYLGITSATSEFLPFVLAMIAMGIAYQKREQGYTYLKPIQGKWGEIVLISLGFKFGITIANYWFALLLKSVGIKLTAQQISTEFMKSGWGMVILLSILAVFIAPFVEEYIFRHLMYRTWSDKIGKVWACIASSILFSLLHFNFVGTISFFGVAVMNCFLYEKYGYRAAVFNHFVFNSLSTILLIGLKLNHLA